MLKDSCSDLRACTLSGTNNSTVTTNQLALARLVQLAPAPERASPMLDGEDDGANRNQSSGPPPYTVLAGESTSVLMCSTQSVL